MAKKEIRQLIQLFNDEKKEEFIRLGTGGHFYTRKQIEYALGIVSESGLRATARILNLHRKTLQRWARKFFIPVNRCPFWVYGWAARRRKKRNFWKLRGF